MNLRTPTRGKVHRIDTRETKPNYKHIPQDPTTTEGSFHMRSPPQLSTLHDTIAQNHFDTAGSA